MYYYNATNILTILQKIQIQTLNSNVKQVLTVFQVEINLIWEQYISCITEEFKQLEKFQLLDRVEKSQLAGLFYLPAEIH